MADDGSFNEVKLPSFKSAPDNKLNIVKSDNVTGKEKQQREEKISDHSTRPYYVIDTCMDDDIYRYERVPNAPIYTVPRYSILGYCHYSDSLRDECQTSDSTRISTYLVQQQGTAVIRMHSQVVKSYLKNGVFRDENGNLYFDPDIFDEKGDEKLLMLYDRDIVTKLNDKDFVALNKRVSNYPDDIYAWLSLVNHSDHNVSARADLERKEIILQKAMASNPNSQRLFAVYLDVLSDLHGVGKMLMVAKQKAMSDSLFLSFYFDRLTHHASSDYNFFSILDEFEHSPSIDLVSFIFDAGYTERALRILECLVFGVKTRFDYDRLFNNNNRSLGVDAFMIPPTVSTDHEAIVEWIGVESYRMFKFAYPRSHLFTYPDEQEEDPDRWCLFEDVVPYFSIKSPPELDSIFSLFGFDAHLPEPYILLADHQRIRYVSFDLMRKVHILRSLPVDVIEMLKRICLHLASEPSACFHYLLLGGSHYVGLDHDEYLLFLACTGKFEEFVNVYRPSTKMDSLYQRILLKLDRLEAVSPNTKLLLESVKQRTIDISIPDPLVFESLMLNDDFESKRLVRSWLQCHYKSSRFAFDSLLQFYTSHSIPMNGLVLPVDDYALYALIIACNNDPALLKPFLHTNTPFAAMQSIIYSETSLDCERNSLLSVDRYPYHKKVHMTAIDRLCAFSCHDRALQILSAMEERGVRCRTLLEELLQS